MKYELWVYLKRNDFWFKAISSRNQDVIDKKKRLIEQGHKVKESINYIGVN